MYNINKSNFNNINNKSLTKTVLILEAGIDVKLEFKAALKQIYGFSLVKLELLNKLFGINTRRSWKFHEIPTLDVKHLNLYLPCLNLFGVKLKKLMDSEREKFLELRCYKRNRYILGFPANGQRTRSNHKTAKKFRIK